MINSDYKELQTEIAALIPEIVSVTFSKNTKNSEYKRIRLDKKNNSCYKVEKFTEKQAFHSDINIEQIESFLLENICINYKNTAISLLDGYTVYFMANKKGKIHKTTSKTQQNQNRALPQNQNNRVKSYIIPEGKPVPFLVELGVMNKEGKILAKSYDKFRQINRFLEFVKDILPDLTGRAFATHSIPHTITKAGTTSVLTPARPLSIIDFGCGKSYLTFAVYHYLKNICGIDCDITGVDLKTDVIKQCTLLAQKCGYTGLQFFCGDIADWKQSDQKPVDLVMTLHACDTATDYALDFSVKHKARVILSVPCCQHELNNVLSQKEMQKNASVQFASLLKYGIIRDKFLSLATDVMRADLLEQHGYKVQVLEFIDMEHTPKNVLIRAVKKELTAVLGGVDASTTTTSAPISGTKVLEASAKTTNTKKSSRNAESDFENLKQALGASITLEKLLK